MNCIDQSIAETLASQGFVILPGFLDESELQQLRHACQPISEQYGVRQVLQNYPSIHRALNWDKLHALLHALDMINAHTVRSIFFNKNADHNWLVSWHQDMTICVNQKIELAGYGKWTYKKDVHYVEPPAAVLEAMLTCRIALDDANTDNAALKVIAGSHNSGKLGALLQERDVDLKQAQLSLDEMASGTIRRANAINMAATASYNGGTPTAGQALFSGSKASDIAVSFRAK